MAESEGMTGSVVFFFPANTVKRANVEIIEK